MADFNGSARSNYFRVRDLDAFTADLERHGITYGTWKDMASIIIDDAETNRPDGAICLFSRSDHGTWPFFSDVDELMLSADAPCPRFVASTEDDADLDRCDACWFPKDEHTLDIDPQEYYASDLPTLVSRHLVDGDVAIFLEVGAEKMRYLGGIAFAINSKGETENIDLDDIYQKAARLGDTVTRAHA